ncbi:MAG TPA: DUF177 domain-containing protein [Saprospiraceae bacterium]|nr:DUF177 domain-containing protein [Saprospiraceae bacterium]
MDALQEYNIPFVGLKLGKHQYNYHIDDTFFTAYKYHDFETIDCDIDLVLEKKTTLLELFFKIQGTAMLRCDTTNEPYKESFDNSLQLIIKFGETYNDDNDEVLILPHSAYQFNVAQYIYEGIVLALPIKRVHPGIKDGTLQSKVLDKLREIEKTNKKQIDPRWDKLNKLLT